jgi:hypothetical protein
VPDLDDLRPKVGVADFRGVQPYKLVLFGEKSSLADVLGDLAMRYQADLYLPTGEISDTLLFQMARVGAQDGRPMVVLTFSDADPAGWQMPISIARKLQAFKAFRFPDLEFQVRRVALTPDQAREHGLPSTPLKESERRSDPWRAAMRVEQTEIDSLTTPRTEALLRRIAADAISPFYDSTLAQRVEEAYAAWGEEAKAAVDDQVGADQLRRIRVEAAEKLAAVRVEVDALNDAMRLDTSGLGLPVPVVPEPELNGHHPGVPLLDSGWSFEEQCRRLIDAKAYRTGGGDGLADRRSSA